MPWETMTQHGFRRRKPRCVISLRRCLSSLALFGGRLTLNRKWNLWTRLAVLVGRAKALPIFVGDNNEFQGSSIAWKSAMVWERISKIGLVADPRLIGQLKSVANIDLPPTFQNTQDSLADSFAVLSIGPDTERRCCDGLFLLRR